MTTPETTEPFTLSDEQTLQALISLEAKIDGLGSQVFNATMLIEHLIEKINLAAASNEQLECLAINLDEYTKYYNQRVMQIQNDIKQAMAAKAGIGPTDLGSGPAIDLGE